MVIFVVLHPVTREKEEILLLKWIDSLKKFGYIFNAVFFHVPPPGSLEFLYSLFLRCCCFYISFLQKPVGITAGPVAIQCLIQGIFHHQSSQKTSRSQVCCWCCISDSAWDATPQLVHLTHSLRHTLCSAASAYHKHWRILSCEFGGN